MALVTTKKMFEKAFEGGYAIGAFNINNMEIIQGVVAAAKAQNSAVILQVSKSALKYAHPKYLKAMVDAAIEETDLDIALHLDHGSDFEVCKDCIEYGFTSVMFDGSHLEYEENVAQTKKIVEYAHERGIVVEAELGKLAGVEDEVNVDAAHATYTDPDQAVDFVKRTGVDSLAIAIGTSHGAYKFKGEAKLDFDRLATITEKLEAAGFLVTVAGKGSFVAEGNRALQREARLREMEEHLTKAIALGRECGLGTEELRESFALLLKEDAR